VFAPERGVENPIIRRAIGLCEEAGMRVTYHADTVEIWFSPTNKRFYTIWSQFLADAEAIFGDRLHEPPKTGGPVRNGFGTRPDAANGAHAANGANGTPHGFADHPSRAAPPQAAAPTGELDGLKREMKILERAIKVVGMQRDEWKREADTLREKLENLHTEMTQVLQVNQTLMLATGGGGVVDRYKQVRQVIVRRLHPDVPGTNEEKAYREKLFKTIWQEIEVLDKK
jgi:hypothetical protein